MFFVDDWGSAPIKSAYNSTCYVLLVASRYNWIFPIKHKSQVNDIFTKFKVQVGKSLERKIKALQIGNDGEFLVLKFVLEEYRIIHQWSYPYTYQQNGLEEQYHRHVVDSGLTLLHAANLPLEFWFFVFTTTVFLYNRTTSKSIIGHSPFSWLFGQNPNLRDIKAFGCQVFPNLHPSQPHYFSNWSVNYVFLGYHQEFSGYLCFNPIARKLIISKDVTSLENDFGFNPNLHLWFEIDSLDTTVESDE